MFAAEGHDLIQTRVLESIWKMASWAIRKDARGENEKVASQCMLHGSGDWKLVRETCARLVNQQMKRRKCGQPRRAWTWPFENWGGLDWKEKVLKDGAWESFRRWHLPKVKSKEKREPDVHVDLEASEKTEERLACNEERKPFGDPSVEKRGCKSPATACSS